MPTNFPGSLDNFTNPTPADDLNTPAVLHSDEHSNANDAIEAIEAWVGVSGTSSTPSHEYRIKQLEAVPPGAAQFGVVGQDEGVPIGTGVTLNFVGDDVTLSRSGTVLRLLHTNPTITFPQELIGVMGQSRGAPLGTGTTLNVNGSRLTISLSGTVLELGNSPDPAELIGFVGLNKSSSLGTGTSLNVSGTRINLSKNGDVLELTNSPDPQELIGIYGLSNGSPLGTGTWLDFGNNLTASLSGTVLRLDASAGGSSFSGVDQIGIYGKDEGQPQGTGTNLNVVGDNVSLSLSGTTLTLVHTNPTIVFPQEVIGVYGQNQGIPLGTGSILNVNGSRLTLSISGTSLELSNSPEPQDNIGIMAYDDSSAVGTGTAVSFGSNLAVVRTGTVLFVDAVAGGAGAAQFGFMGRDEGVSLGTGSILNVVGDNISLSLSGTTLTLDHTNPTIVFPVELIGIYGQDEGTNLGTGTTLNVTGENITLSLSGSVLNLSQTNPTIVFPQEVIGVYGQNQGVPLGTGSILNVNGSRLVLSISGTSLELTNSPDPQELIGMMGNGLGTGTILSVSGGRLSMTLTGSSLNIISSPEPIDNIGVYGLNNGLPLGTGTWIDFGNNLSTSLLGTTLRVDVQNTVFPQDNIGLMGWDEGIPQGTGTIFNVVGGRGVLSRSGTVLELNISPDPVELIGIMGLNKSSSLGTGTTLNVSGTRINLSRNGDVLELTNSPDPVELIGVYGLANGIPLGTGTWIDFGDNLTTTISGTTLRVNASAGQGGGGSMGFVGRDEGVFVGTGTVLDVVGSRATLSFSNPVFTLNISPDPVDNIGVFGRNNGTNLGTGTVIDFGQGLNAAITGTTLFVHPFGGGLTGDAWIRNTGVAQGMAWTNQDFNIQFHLGDGTNVISTGSTLAGYAYIDVPVDSVVESWEVMADATGSIVVDIFKSTFSAFPPTAPLAGLGQPLMSNLRKNSGNATGTASLLKTDVLLASVSSVSTLKLATVSLQCKKVATS